MVYKNLRAKLVLLLSEKNSFLKYALKPGCNLKSAYSIKKHGKTISVDPETMRVQLREQKTNIRPQTISKICEIINESSSHHGIRLDVSDFTDSNAYDFGAKLGFDWQDVQRLCDEKMVQLRTPVLGLALDNIRSNALNVEYSGLYYLYHTSPNFLKETGVGADDYSGDLLYRRSTLRVRHILNLPFKGDYCLKIRACLSRSLDSSDHYEYHGVLTGQGNSLYWVMDQAQTAGFYDLAFVVSKREVQAGMLLGIFSSATINHTPYSSRALIVRKPGIDMKDREKVFSFMQKHPRIFKTLDACLSDVDEQQQDFMKAYLSNAPLSVGPEVQADAGLTGQ